MTHEQRDPKKLSSSFWVGAIILAVGTFLLLDRMDIYYFPSWLFSWKTFLIGMGLFLGISKKFEGIAWLVLILVGTFFMLDDIPGFPYDLDQYAFPVGIIIIGGFIVGRALLRQDKASKKKEWDADKQGLITNESGGEDYFDLTTAFGGTKKRVFSKKFKGGDTTCFFGGTEIDLTQADFEGQAHIDMFQMFGGVKLIVPANWEIKSDVTAILGGIEDKRNNPQGPTATNKKLILDGFVMFGGVEIKSY